MRSGITFIIKTSALYGILATAFSLIGFFLVDLPFSTTIIGSPLEVSGVSAEHIIGHIVWGLMIGIVTFRSKYFLIAGLFTIILDADHLIQFLGVEVVPRMAHSVLFGLIAITCITIQSSPWKVVTSMMNGVKNGNTVSPPNKISNEI